jgi:hypothetical protein
MMDCATEEERTAIADYISDLTAELALMAAWAEHTDLARLLEMARLESEQLCGRNTNAATAPDGAITQDSAVQSESSNVVLLSALRVAQR